MNFPPCSTIDMLRIVISRQTCASIHSSAILSRIAGSLPGAKPSKVLFLTKLTMSSSRRTEIR